MNKMLTWNFSMIFSPISFVIYWPNSWYLKDTLSVPAVDEVAVEEKNDTWPRLLKDCSKGLWLDRVYLLGPSDGFEIISGDGFEIVFKFKILFEKFESLSLDSTANNRSFILK